MKRHSIKQFTQAAVLVIGLITTAVPAALHADSTSASNGNTATDALARHVIAGGGLPTGGYSLDARSYDTLGPHAKSSSDTNTGTYNLNKKQAASTIETSDPGPKFDPKARASINWGPGFWTSQGSYAKIDDGPNPSGTAPESAYANAFVLDPQFYTVKFDPRYKPEIDFSLTISAGTSLTAHGSSSVWSSASITGSFTTSLLLGPLWTFSWSADSTQPNSSDFQFWSNPALGLNDGAIQSAFLADVTEAGGVHTVNSDFKVNAAIFPNLPKGQWTLSYSVGGVTDYDAQAAASGVTPEPSSLLLLGSGVLGASALLRKRLLTRS